MGPRTRIGGWTGWAALALVGLAGACSGGAGTSDAGGTGGQIGAGDDGPSPTDATTGDASDAGGVCGSVANSGPTVTLTGGSQVPPAAAGGTLVTGTYLLTSFTFVSSGSACPVTHSQAAIAVKATSDTDGTIEEISSTDIASVGLSVRDSRSTWTYHTAGSAMTVTAGCVGALSALTRNASSPLSYTASVAEVRAYGPNGSCGPTLSIFLRQ